MRGEKKGEGMLSVTIVIAIITLILFLITYLKGENQHIRGLKAGIKMMRDIFPLLIFAFLMAGLLQEILPQELLNKWLGKSAGIKGIFIGTIAGGICPGGPYVSFPLAAGFLRMGVSIPTIVAFITSWSLWAVARLPMEVGILGWKFTLFRLASTFIFPPLAGLISKFYLSIINIR
jgi:uncharacterized membrane protein YraQ (UPF0718 family)